MSILSNMLHLFFGISRPLTLGVRCILYDDAGSVMLVRHTYIPGWHLPGGGVEVGEDCEVALGREVEEECQVTITGKPSIVGIYFNSQVSPRDHVILYQSVSWGKDYNVPVNRCEIAESGIFSLNDLPIDIDPWTRQRLVEWKGSGESTSAW